MMFISAPFRADQLSYHDLRILRQEEQGSSGLRDETFQEKAPGQVKKIKTLSHEGMDKWNISMRNMQCLRIYNVYF
jgi:hypothetical protein